MGGTARIVHEVPAHEPGEHERHAQNARDWVAGEDVTRFLEGLADPAAGMPSHALNQHVHVTVEWK